MDIKEELINNFIDAIFPLPDEFGVYIDDYGESSFPLYYKLQDEVTLVDPEAKIHYGMSKLVITSPSLGSQVIKIPFNGYHIEENNYNCETGEVIDEEIIWNPFSYSGGSDNSDYCVCEYEKYLQLKAENLSCFVAEVKYFKTVEEKKIFIQEFVTPIENCYPARKASNDSLKIAETLKKEVCLSAYIDDKWIANCIDSYGKEKVKQFLIYCEEVDNDIFDDAHMGNYGYRPDGTPAFLDYSNYKD